MPKTPRPKIRTIRRRPDWPAWAKWRTLTCFGDEFMWSHKPTGTTRWGTWRGPSRPVADLNLEGTGRRCCEEARRWRSSLRRIAGKVRG